MIDFVMTVLVVGAVFSPLLATIAIEAWFGWKIREAKRRGRGGL